MEETCSCPSPCAAPDLSEAGHGHGGSAAHHRLHVHIEDTSGSRLLVTLLLNLIIPVVQIAGGIQAHSMALISDAVHNFSDFAAVLITYIANRIARRGASVRNTFGYRRAEIMAAVLNVALLVGAAVFIVYEAMHRLLNPEPVIGSLVVVVAGIGVIGNGFSAWLLHHDSGHNLNVRSAFLHMLGDLLTSVVVAINGVVMIYRPWYWLDPVLSAVIALLILKSSWGILREATCILMNATPSGLDLYKVRSFLEHTPGVSGVHYLHAWNVCQSSIAFSCHIVVPDQSLSKIDAMSEGIRDQLLHLFGIDHPVLQFETVPCGGGSIFCEMACGSSGGCSVPPPPAEEEDREESMHSLFRKPVLFWIRLLFGAVFLIASVDKIVHPGAFAEIIRNYDILPGVLINPVAVILPWLELTLGISLLLGLWLPGSAAMATFLLTVFFAALLFNFVRGVDVSCGCFTTSTSGSHSMVWYLLRDAILVALSWLMLVNVYRRDDGLEAGRERINAG